MKEMHLVNFQTSKNQLVALPLYHAPRLATALIEFDRLRRNETSGLGQSGLVARMSK
jgi:hypothetical protein